MPLASTMRLHWNESNRVSSSYLPLLGGVRKDFTTEGVTGPPPFSEFSTTFCNDSGVRRNRPGRGLFPASHPAIGGDQLQPTEDLIRENDALRERLARLGEAGLRINEDLDMGTVLQGVLDSARSLTGARYGVFVLHDADGNAGDFLASGMTPEETGRLWNIPGWPEHFGYLSRIPGPLRVHDLLGHIRTLGLPELVSPVEVSERVSFLAFPVLHRGERVGSIFLAEKEAGQEFSREDEEILGAVRLPVGSGHRQRPPSPGGAAGQKRPGNPD